MGTAMPKKTLSDRTLKALARKPAAKGKTKDIMDAVVPGFGVRVSETGRRTFVLMTRYPGSPNPTRRALGIYGQLTLEQARSRARDWLELIRRGIDPAIHEERQRQAALRQQANSFAAVAEDFIRDKLPSERHGHESERDLRNVFIPLWGGRPITDITEDDIIGFIHTTKRRGPYAAHNLFALARRFFRWARAQRIYGLKLSPCLDLEPRALIGEKAVRTRVLSDTELRAFWMAAQRTPYPYGPLLQMLALTGQRRAECAEATWSEFDLPRKLWTIPTGRMKSEATHVVPLTDEVTAILATLPRFKNGELLFSVTGNTALNGFTRAKRRLDAAVLAALRAQTGDQGAKLPPFTLHDVRRTMRTHLSALPVSDLVRELVIGHTKPGLHKVYDQYAYIDEKRHALELWAARLRDIVTPPPDNVINMAARV
jgi:integrase